MSYIDEKKLTRALIMNALLLPGSGHYYIGARVQGSFLALATVVFLAAPAIRFVIAFSFALKNTLPTGVSGSLGILAAMSYAWRAHGGFILISLLAVLILWAYSIADIAIRIRRNR